MFYFFLKPSIVYIEETIVTTFKNIFIYDICLFLLMHMTQQLFSFLVLFVILSYLLLSKKTKFELVHLVPI